MSDSTNRNLLKRQLYRFRLYLWCLLPLLALTWLTLTAVVVLPEHWLNRMDVIGVLPIFVTMSLAFLLTFVVQGTIVFKTLGERTRLSTWIRAAIASAFVLGVFPALYSLLGNPLPHLTPWFRTSMEWALASSQGLFEMSVIEALVISAQLFILIAASAVLPLVFVLLLALLKSPQHNLDAA